MAEGDKPLLTGTLADEEAAMRSGRGGMLVGWGLAAVAVIGGLLFLMGGDDDARVYRDLGKQINGLKQAHFDKFWGCTLEGANLQNVKTNADLAYQIDGRGGKGVSNYAIHVRDQCMKLLSEIEPQLDTLIVPAELVEHTAAMSAATGDLRSAWNGYVTYLDDEELEYDGDAARPLISKITKGWYDFKKAHSAFNKVLKTKLE